MNGREKMFFKDIKLHRSMSYTKKLDEEFVRDSREKYRRELMKKQEDKARAIKRNNSIIFRIIRYIGSLSNPL